MKVLAYVIGFLLVVAVPAVNIYRQGPVNDEETNVDITNAMISENMNLTSVEGEEVHEGDMLIKTSDADKLYGRTGEATNMPQRGATRENNAIFGALWIGDPPTVPYVISPELESAEPVIKEGIEEIEKVSCIKFRKKGAADNDYIHFILGQGCSSYVGRTGGEQNISLSQGCWFKGIVAHELLHALGFLHEQSRPDRDQFVNVLYANIRDGFAAQFDKYSTDVINSLNEAYDYKSIMHYGNKAFSALGEDTIEKKNDSQYSLGGGSSDGGLTASDAKQLRLLYKCPEPTVSPGVTTGEPGETTFGPVVPTDGPGETTFEPVVPTDGPGETTFPTPDPFTVEPPLPPTPGETTFGPVVPTDGPGETTFPPPPITDPSTGEPPLPPTPGETTLGPVVTTGEPGETTFGPVIPTDGPGETTFPPLPITDPFTVEPPLPPTPGETTLGPVVTTGEPGETTFGPVIPTDGPGETTFPPPPVTGPPLPPTLTTRSTLPTPPTPPTTPPTSPTGPTCGYYCQKYRNLVIRFNNLLKRCTTISSRRRRRRRTSRRRRSVRRRRRRRRRLGLRDEKDGKPVEKLDEQGDKSSIKTNIKNDGEQYHPKKIEIDLNTDKNDPKEISDKEEEINEILDDAEPEENDGEENDGEENDEDDDDDKDDD